MVLLQSIDSAQSVELLQKLPPKFFMRLSVDLVSVFILIRFIYLPVQRNRELVFTLFLFNLIIFLITYLLNKVELSMGAAFGLFAVFSMLRYRTEGISIKDMTYLFMVIAMGLITAVSKGDWDELIFLCGLLLIITFLLEHNAILKKESSRWIIYEKIELISPEKKGELLADLEARTGIKINHFNIGEIDFLKDTVQIQIFYFEN